MQNYKAHKWLCTKVLGVLVKNYKPQSKNS